MSGVRLALAISFPLLLGAMLSLSGCAGSVRSGSVDQLAKIEAQKLDTLHNLLVSQKPAVNTALDKLNDSYQMQFDGQIAWQREVLDAKVVAAVPGNIKNPEIKHAVYVEIANQHLDQTDIFLAQKRNFAAAITSLEEAYAKLIDAIAQSQKDFQPVVAYASSSNVAFGIQSIDVATVGAAISEFQKAEEQLAQAQRAADKVLAATKAVSNVAPGSQDQNFLSILSLISNRVKEVPHQ
jgi:hypothetical protein